VGKHLVLLALENSQPAVPRFKSSGSTSSGGLVSIAIETQFLFFITNREPVFEKNDA